MNKNKKIIIAIIGIVFLLTTYFFIPKTATKCSYIDGSCTTCTCNMGFPYITDGGSLEPSCLFGKAINCKQE